MRQNPRETELGAVSKRNDYRQLQIRFEVCKIIQDEVYVYVWYVTHTIVLVDQIGRDSNHRLNIAKSDRLSKTMFVCVVNYRAVAVAVSLPLILHGVNYSANLIIKVHVCLVFVVI